MKQRKMPIGVSDFKRVRQDNAYYVDKSLYIKEIIEDSSSVILIPRPRRFGKTLNMSMLSYFFDNNDSANNRKLFDGLNIEKESVFDEHQGKHPVIFITLKDIKGKTYSETIQRIRLEISSLYERHAYLLSSDKISLNKKQLYETIIYRSASDVDYQTSLKFLSELLWLHYDLQSILLIDEYDTPIHSGFSDGFYDEIISFARVFLGDAIKDNSYLYKGVLTGTLRISKESVFTGLNNLGVYSMLRSEYSDKFGFTPLELHEIMDYFELSHMEADVQHWYNGYIVGKQEIYNPWSIINFVANVDHHFIAYWVNTSSNDLIKQLIKESPAEVKLLMQDLIKGVPVLKTLNENISFPELFNTADAIFSFLVFSGYLKAEFSEMIKHRNYYNLSIPNIEIRLIFEDIIINWFAESYENKKVKQLLQALLTGNIAEFERTFSDLILSTLSYFDTQTKNVEKVYQAFILGMLVNLSETHAINSEKESGFGRYDIAILPKDLNKKAIIMELKIVDSYYEETKDTALDKALQQIEDKKYETNIRNNGYNDILKLGVVFDGKRVWVREGKLQ